ADPTFGNGTQIGLTGWYCVYNGTGTNVTVSGLSENTNYIFQVFEYIDACGANYPKYNSIIATDNPKSQNTTGPASVEVTATAGTLGPTLYVNLKSAFDAINAGTHQGGITIKIIGNTTESATAFLNASAAPSDYAFVNIYPTITGLYISGTLAAPLIDLNGAGNVTINGSLNGLNAGKDLTIINASASAASGTSTIRFINDATGNTVTNCKIMGSSTDVTAGTLFFSTGTATGNNGNMVNSNDITSATNSERSVNAIFSSGISGSENSGNTISDNHIYDFLNAVYSANGIFIIDNSSGWNITGNSFYETTLFAPGIDYIDYTAINIGSGGNNFTVSGNFIGGNAPGCGGTAMTVNAAFNHTFTGIYMNVGTTTPSSVQNNTIKNMAYGSTSSNTWVGISIDQGSLNIGTTTGNTIGSSTETGSITVTNLNPTFRASTTGIMSWSGGIIDIQHNTIAGITTAADPTQPNNFYGVLNYGSGAKTISNNMIGSTTIANSIHASSTSTDVMQEVYGINSEVGNATISGNTIANMTNGTTSSGTSSGMEGSIIGIRTSNGANNITNNVVRDMTIGNVNTLSSIGQDNDHPSIIGICQESSAAGQIVAGNTIYNLSNSYPSFAGCVIGIYYLGGTFGSNLISKNFIHSLSVTGQFSTTASLYGIKIEQGTASCYNNVISLGGNSATDIYGIFEDGNNTDYLYFIFNTVYIGGSLDAGATNSSYALYSGGFFGYVEYEDNIFHNARSTASGSDLHFAAFFEYYTRPSFTCNYNDYFVSGTGGALGFYTNVTNTLPIVTGQDTYSLNTSPNFLNAGGTVAANYIPTATLNGTGSEGFPKTDYAGTTREDTPTMGAFEKLACANPTNGGTISGNQAGCNPFDPALITCTNATGQTGTLEYKWQSSPDNSVFSDIPGATSTDWNPDPLTSTTYFKRKARVTCMANWTGAAESAVAQMTVNEPVSAITNVLNNVSCFGGSNGSVKVSATGGSSTYSYLWNSTPPQYTEIASGLSAGTYAVTVTDANTCSVATTVAITQPAVALTAIADQSKRVSCWNGSDGEATVTAGGGWGTYTYKWNDAAAQTTFKAINLTAGVYTVTVTDLNSCTKT
ncbi:MAG: SprB repeat-containing protein, partial [Bacteroidota bacterium]